MSLGEGLLDQNHTRLLLDIRSPNQHDDRLGMLTFLELVARS